MSWEWKYILISLTVIVVVNFINAASARDNPLTYESWPQSTPATIAFGLFVIPVPFVFLWWLVTL